MATATDVARYFLSIQDQEAGELITHLKLQKLLYYAQGYHLALYGAPLFDAPIEAWGHGPAVREVWDQYKHCGQNPIDESVLPADLSHEARYLLDTVYHSYGQYAAWKLRDMTHREKPWLAARERGVWSEVIPVEEMTTFFRAMLQRPSPRPLTWATALQDPRFKSALDEGLADAAAGRTVAWSEIEQSLPA